MRTWFPIVDVEWLVSYLSLMHHLPATMSERTTSKHLYITCPYWGTIQTPRQKMKCRRKKGTEPRWKVITLWMLVGVLICLLSVMYYNRLSPPSFVAEGQYYICIGYPNVFKTDFYCCENGQFSMKLRWIAMIRLTSPGLSNRGTTKWKPMCWIKNDKPLKDSQIPHQKGLLQDDQSHRWPYRVI